MKRWLGGLWNTLTGTAARGRRQTRDRSGQRCRFHPALHPLEDRLAPAVASITPLSWNVVGLDSNNVNVGPNAFLIGARVTADNAGVSNLVVRYIEDGANNTLISPVGATTLTQATLAPGASQDFYFTVSVTRSSAAYTTVQKYHIEAFQDVGNDQLPNSGETVLSTPPNRELFVEHLISQNRNNVDSVSVLGKPPVDPANPQPVRVVVGETLNVRVSGKTATGGYEQLVFETTFPSSIFQILSVAQTYAVPNPNGPNPNDRMYADAAVWDNDPTSLTYNQPLSTGKAGGNPISSVYTVKVIGTGTGSLNSMIYDFSGSSFHYNSDFGTGVEGVDYVRFSAEDPADLSLTQTGDDPDGVVNPGQNVTFILALTNSGPADAASVQVKDLLPNGYTFVSASFSDPTDTYSSATGIWNVGTLTSGANAQMQITATVNGTGSLLNTAEVFASSRGDLDSTPNNNVPTEDDQATVSLVRPPDVDLSLGITANQTNVNVGNTLTYTITLTNTNLPINGSSNTATGVQVSAAIPSGLSGVTVTPGTGTFSGGIWSVPTLAEGASVTLTITGTVLSTGTLAYPVQVTAADQPDPDSTPNNNNPAEDDQASVTPYRPADLSLTKTAGSQGSNNFFDLTVTNSGPEVATNVQVRDVLPAGVTYASDNGGGAYDRFSGIWNVGTVTVGTPRILRIFYTVNGTGILQNVAEIVAVDQLDPDSTPNNGAATEDDWATATAPIPGSAKYADLSLTETLLSSPSGTPQVNPGDTVTFHFTLANAGPNATGQIVVEDILPLGLTYVSSTASAGSYNSTSGQWTLPSGLSNGGSATLNITATVNATGSVTNIAEVVEVYQSGGSTPTPLPDPDSVPANDDPTEDDRGVVSLNRRPTANNNTASVTEDGPTTDTGNVITDDDGFGVDSDPDNDLLTVGAVNGQAANVGAAVNGTYGSVVIDGTGIYTYTLNNASALVQALRGGQTVTDSFTYTASDGKGGTSVATLTVTINGRNDPPSATNNTAAVTEDTTLTDTGNVLTENDGFGIDSDIEGDTLTVSAANGQGVNVGVSVSGNYGSVVINGNGSYTYTLNNALAAVQALAAGQTVQDSFSYTVSNGKGGFATANLIVTVTGVNDAPVAKLDTNTVTEDTPPNPVIGNVLTNDTDVDTGTILTVSEVDGVSAQVGVAVTGTFGSVTINSNGTYSYALNNANPAVQALAVGQILTDSFTYTASDGSSSSSSMLTITINGSNDAPTAQDNAYTTNEDTAVSGNILTDNTGAGVDSDPDTGETATLVVSAVNGNAANVGSAFVLASGATLTVAANGTMSYDPTTSATFNALPVGQSTTDSFTYTIRDVNGATSTANVTITINGRNDAPTARDNTYTTNAATSVSGNLLTDNTGAGVDSDPDTGETGTLTVSAINGVAASVGQTITLPSGATLTVQPGGTFTYTPQASLSGTDSFSYTIADANGGTSTATVTITVIPVADLQVTKTSPAAVIPGTDLTYTLTVQNNGASTAQIITVTDNLPTGTRFVSLTQTSGPSFGSSTPAVGSNGTVTLSRSSLAASASATFDLVVHVDSGVTGSLTNTATGTTTTNDSNSNNDSSTASTSATPQADLRITKTAQASIVLGSGLTYTITVSNIGFSDAQTVSVVDSLPTGTTFVSLTQTSGPSFGSATPGAGTNGTVTLTRSALVAGANATFDLVVHVNTSTTGSLANTATGTTSTSDAVANNDVSTATIAVRTSASGRVFFDADGNGSQGANEPGIPNATVTVLWFGPDGVIGGGDDQSFTVATNASGDWVASDIPAGNLRGTVSALPNGLTAPTSDPDGIGTPNTADVSASSSSPTNLNFGYRGTGSVGGQTWNDQDGNGLHNASEPGLPVVDVTLTWLGFDGVPGGGDDVTFTATTNSAGGFSFANLPAGNFRISTDPTDLPANLTPTADPDGTATPDTAVLTLTPGQSRADIDFGYQGNSSVGGVVWYDVDANGFLNHQEPGIQGITVTLVFGGLDGDLSTTADNVPYVTTTDANGAFRVIGLPVGAINVGSPNYRITIGNVPPAFTVRTFDPDGVGTPDTAGLTLQASQAFTGGNFGYRGTSNTGVSGFAWNDQNGSGRQDGGEPGIDGVTVNLYDAGTHLLAVTTTTGGGLYNFPGLVPGTYRVQFIVPAGLTFTARDVGPDDTVDSDADPATGFTGLVSVTAGISDDTVDAGLYPSASVNGLIWYDTDSNGLRGGGEPGIPGATVTLTWFGPDGVLGGGDDRTFATTTDASGRYTATNLPPGNYGISVSNQPNGLTLATAGPTTFSLTSGASRDVDLGFRGPGAVGNRVWYDVNSDGSDLGEPGVSGVTVSAVWLGFDGVTSGDDVGYTATTDAKGSFGFNNLPLGNFRVTVNAATLPPDLVPTFDLNSGTANPDGTTALTLTGGSPGQNAADFGYTGKRIAAGRVWLDFDGDAVQDGDEPGLRAATLIAVWAGPNGILGDGDDVARTTSTDATGSYSFGNLPPGVYWVAVTGGLPPGVRNTGDPDGIFDGQVTLWLGPTDTATALNFGYQGGASLSGSVFAATPGKGLGGVFITLTGTDVTGNTISRGVVTSADGSYSFGGLLAGSYTLSEMQPAAYNDDLDTAGSLGGTVGNDVVAGIILPTGASGAGYNFAARGGTISGRVFVDANRDAILSPGESGLGGVTVILRDAGGNVVATAVSAADGSYTFTNLPVGNYTLTETQPTGYGSSTSNARVITLPLGGVTGQDFGDTTGSISGTVYVDANNNGVRDPGEAGVSGVVMTLTGTDDRGQAVSQTLTTGADGGYAFVNLLSGTYRLGETQPTNLLQSKNTAGVLGGTVGGIDLFEGIVLAAGSTGQGYAFGEVPMLTPTSMTYGDSFTSLVVPSTITRTSVVDPSLSKDQFFSQPDAATLTRVQGANRSFVDGLYRALLARPADKAGLDYWGGVLDSGAPRQWVVDGVYASAEHRALQVDQMFGLFLHRHLDDAGRAFFVNAFFSGATEADVAASILGSQEYYVLHNGGTGGFLQGLYAEVLGRKLDASGQNFWGGELQNGLSRQAAALSILQSTAAITRALACDYHNLLGRVFQEPDYTGWLPVMQQGLSPQDGTRMVLASDEFFARMAG